MIKHEYLIEARGHPGHDVIRNFYQSQGLEDGKIYNRQFRCVGKDEWVTKNFKDKDGNEKEQEGWKGGDGENTVNLQQLIQGTYATMVGKFPILRTAGHKFTPGVATMWTRGEFGKMFEDPIFNTFNTVLEMIVKFHKDEYDGYLRRVRKEKKQTILIDNDVPTAEELIDRFSQAREEDIQATKDRINAKEYENTKYFIRPITEYDDLLRYKPFCYPYNVWCLMNGKNAWDSYTSNGMNQFYLVLDKRLCNENGDPILENKDIIPTEQGEEHPNDEYGLSMMGIIVDMDGELAYCTTRWNHAGKGSDHTMDAEEISDTLGVNFYQTFLPNTIFQDTLNKIMQEFNKTKDFNVFDSWDETEEDGITIIEINNKFNLINKNNEIISNKWFNSIEEADYGLFCVKYKNRKNLMDINGNFICKTWYSEIEGFIEGFSPVKIDKKEKCWNYINNKGELLSDTWFDEVNFFNNGVGKVKYNKMFNFINTVGQPISNTWFDNVQKIKNNIIPFFIKGKGWNLINTDGEILYDTWFKEIANFNENFFHIINNKGCNLINKNGELISKKYFEKILEFIDNIFAVYVKNKGWNLINTNGEFLLNIWLDFINPFRAYSFLLNKELFQVRIKDEGYFFIDKEYNLYKSNETDRKKFDFVKNIAKKLKSNRQIANESLRNKYAKELNEILDLNKRIKKLYE